MRSVRRRNIGGHVGMVAERLVMAMRRTGIQSLTMMSTVPELVVPTFSGLSRHSRGMFG